MTKLRPNDPCPCGSGRKVKRCCGDPSKVAGAKAARTPPTTGDQARDRNDAAAAGGESSDRTHGAGESVTWLPIDTSRIPKRLLAVRDLNRMLPASNRVFVAQVATYLGHGTVASARDGLRLLEAVPDDQLRAVWPLPDYKIMLLEFTGDREGAWGELLRLMSERRDEASWLQFSNLLVARVAADEDGARHLAIEQLREAMDRCGRTTLRFVVGLGLTADDDRSKVDEGTEMLHRALLDPMWEANRALLGRWRRSLSNGFITLIGELLKHDRRAEARAAAQRACAFTWTGSKPLPEERAGDLLGVMFRAGALDEVNRLGRELVRGGVDGPTVRFWLGQVAMKRGDSARALRDLREAVGAPHLTDRGLESMLRLFFEQRQWQLALDVVERMGNRQSPRMMYYEASALLGLGQTERAHELAARLWAEAPSHRASFSLRRDACEATGRQDELQSWYREILETADSPFELEARVGIARELLRADRDGEALEVLAPWLEELPPVSDPVTLAIVHNTMGDALAAGGRPGEAAAHYERAARLDPGPEYSARLTRALLETGQQDQAETEASMGLQVWPDWRPLLIAAVLAADARGSWSQSLERITCLGDPWELEPGLREVIVVAKVRALGELDRPMEALECFEGHLDATLNDEGLRRLREAIVQEAKRRFAQLERMVEREQRRLRAHHEDTRRAVAELHREAERKRAEINRLLRKRDSAAPRTASSQQVSWDGPELPAGLAPHHRALIDGAERAWGALAERPDDDHGAVVMQLARVIEALVNQHLVDPMAALCVERHDSVQALQAVTSGRVAARDNRLSLGEAVAVLYADYEQRDADGSVALVRNPRSTEAHGQVANQLWTRVLAASLSEEDGRYLRHQLPVELLELARIRNQAGHADSPLPRRAASQARLLVLGDDERRGIVHRLGQRLDGSAGGQLA